MRALILPLMLLVAACSPAPETASTTGAPLVEQSQPQSIPVLEGPDDGAPPTAAERAACDERGGRLQRAGMRQMWVCFTPYADAGKRCTDSDQCEGDCMLDTKGGRVEPDAPAVGQCQADTNRFGCTFTVEDGRVGPGLCVD